MSGLIRKLRKVKADATAAPADAQGSEEPMMREASSGNLLASGPPTPSGPMAYYGGFAQPQTPRTSTPNGLLLGAGTPMTAHSYDSHGSSWINQHEAYDIMAAHLFKIARSKNWFSEDPNVASGVALRLAKAQYAMCPAADPRLEGFYQALSLLNCEVAMKVTSPVVAAITTRLPPNTTQVPLTPSEHIQVVETMADLAGARKAQNAAFIRTEKTLVVWCDHVDRLEVSAQSLEDKMIAFVWKSASAAQSASGHDKEMREWNMEQSASQMGHGVSTQGHNSPFRAEFNEKDAEKQEPEYEERVTNLQAPLLHGLAVALDIILCCLLAREYNLNASILPSRSH